MKIIPKVFELYALMRLKGRYLERNEEWRLKAKDMGYDIHQLDMMFDVMMDRTAKEDNHFLHWKDPIHCEIPAECINVAETACIFFHGSSNPRCYTDDKKIFIKDDGYQC